MKPEHFKTARKLAQDLCNKKVHTPAGEEFLLADFMVSEADNIAELESESNDLLEEYGRVDIEDLLRSSAAALKDFAAGKKVDQEKILKLPEVFDALLQDALGSENQWKEYISPENAAQITNILNREVIDLSHLDVKSVGDSASFTEALQSEASKEYFASRKYRLSLEEIASEVKSFIDTYKSEQRGRNP